MTQGTVFVNFIVGKDGTVRDIKIVKGVPGAPDLDAEALRLVRMMPAWKPGRMGSTPVRVMYSLPVRFRIEG